LARRCGPKPRRQATVRRKFSLAIHRWIFCAILGAKSK